MNTKPFLVSLSLACGWASGTHAQSTAFTYQGRLALSDSAVNGLYDLRVTIYDALTNGNALAGPLTNVAVLVTNGLFTATLDFGAAAFPGANRWLDIGVRTNGSVTAFTALVPRLRITAAPYAIQAASAANFSGTLPAANGGSGQSSYAPGDMLYASAANTLARLAVGSTGQVLAVSGSAPAWKPANAHDHIGQAWSGAVATDALYVGNTSAADGASALTGVASAAASLNYGVFGQTSSTNGTGMQGLAIAVTGSAVGVAGESDSTAGIGVYGFGGALSGAPIGVYGETSAPNGYGLYTPNRLYIGDAAYFAGNVTLLTGAKLLADSGTTNAPGIAFSSSPGAGVFTPATNVVGFATLGRERLRIAADGKVGIGVSAPTNIIQVAGGARCDGASWINASDRNLKENFASVDAREILAKVAALPITRWNYKADTVSRHLGPVAQDFRAAFGVGADDTGIATVDAEGVALAAIQGLAEIVMEREAEMASLKIRNAALERRLEALEKLMTSFTPNPRGGAP